MSTFWIITWVTWAGIIFLTAFVSIFFDIDDDRIPIAYVLLADILGAIPGANLIFALAIIIAIIGGVVNQDLTPKENPFGENE